MNTPIIKISADQNVITHESGVVTEFIVPKGGVFCTNCVYINSYDCYEVHCTTAFRDDKRNGIFILKK